MKAAQHSTDLTLFGTSLENCAALVQFPATPIAAALQDHFAKGGSAADAVRMVELIELRNDPKRAARGSRLAPDWQPGGNDLAYATSRMDARRVELEIEKFRNYWTAKTGTAATKRDWGATWRNWIIQAMERGYGPPSYQGQRPGNYPSTGRAASREDAILTGMGRVSRDLDDRRAAKVGGQ